MSTKVNSQSAAEQPISEIIARLGKNRLLLIGLIGIAALLALQMIWPGEQVTRPVPNAVPVSSSQPSAQGTLGQVMEYRQALEKQLASTLTQMQGVGKVNVMLSLASGPEVVPAMNVQTSKKTTDEKDSNSGTRVTNEDTINSSIAGGGSSGIVALQEKMPPVTGVVVVAQGADQAEVRLAITRAVQTIFNMPAHQVQVIPGK